MYQFSANIFRICSFVNHYSNSNNYLQEADQAAAINEIGSGLRLVILLWLSERFVRGQSNFVDVQSHCVVCAIDSLYSICLENCDDELVIVVAGDYLAMRCEVHIECVLFWIKSVLVYDILRRLSKRILTLKPYSWVIKLIFIPHKQTCALFLDYIPGLLITTLFLESRLLLS